MAALICVSVLPLSGQRKKSKAKDKEEITQTLEVPAELPNLVLGETGKLTFHVTPLSARGLLSQQIRDSLKVLDRTTGSSTILKIRAFVAGSGDMRRVRDLVSEIFTDRRQPLPALSLIRAGGLPLEGAQVVLEAIASGRKVANPDGLVFISAQPATSDHPLDRVAPLSARTLASLRQTLRDAGSEAADVLRVTCFMSSLENLAATRKLVEAEYPRAALNYVQSQRAPGEAMSACEAVARSRRKGSAPFELIAAPGRPEAGQSAAAIVSAPLVLFTGTQISFGYQEADSRLALERLSKELEQAGSSTKNVACARYYPLSSGIAAQVRKVRTEFFEPARPPAGSMVVFEGLPSMDAGFAVDVVAVKQQ